MLRAAQMWNAIECLDDSKSTNKAAQEEKREKY